jgi:hypothetical protein
MNMPGMMQSTVKALNFIGNFPKDEQQTSRKIYFEMETVQMYQLVKLIGLLAAFLGMGYLWVSIFPRPNLIAILFSMSIAAFVEHKLVNESIIEKILIAKKINLVRTMLLVDPDARAGFEKLKELRTLLGPNIGKIAAKYRL